MRDLFGIDVEVVIYTELARHAPWRARERSGALIKNLPFGQGPEVIAAHLEAVIEDIRQATCNMKADS